MDKQAILQNSISPHASYCDGYGNPGASGNGYIATFLLGVGTAPIALSHPGSQVLDEINAFDKAEVESANLGQINMITVSSFCGPQGLIWGYDLARPKELYAEELSINARNNSGKKINVYSLKPLLRATRELFGTVSEKHFPLLPGSHVPTAGKNFKFEGPKHIYSAIAVGVPVNREDAAILLMEDIGWIPAANHDDTAKVQEYSAIIQENLVKSILEVGKNQLVDYLEVFAGLKCVWVNPGEIGCALVAAPYLTLAQNAVPKDIDLTAVSLNEWRKSIHV